MKRPGTPKRRTPLPRRRRPRVVTAAEQAARAAWHLEAQRRGCEVRDGHDCQGPIQGHHVIRKAFLKKWGMLDRLWDLRNLLGVCEWRHERHTNAFERIDVEHLRPEHFEFAYDVGLQRALADYPGAVIA